tara:strand:- start:73 stop:501 length:429 start_codon:yes stop_codon:yes gene_type:complete
MASILKVDTLTGNTTAKTVTVTVGASATQSLETGLVKAWINANTGSSPATNDSFNFSSITDNADGDESFNFTNNMANDDFAVGGMAKSQDSAGTRMAALNFHANGGLSGAIGTSFYRLNMHYANTTLRHCNLTTTFAIGDLA